MVIFGDKYIVLIKNTNVLYVYVMLNYLLNLFFIELN